MTGKSVLAALALVLLAGAAHADVTLKCTRPAAAPKIPDPKTMSAAAMRESAKAIETSVPAANAYMDCLTREMNRVKADYDNSVARYKAAVDAYNKRTGKAAR